LSPPGNGSSGITPNEDSTTKSGDPVFRAVVVPRRFETRTTGMEIYSR